MRGGKGKVLSPFPSLALEENLYCRLGGHRGLADEEGTGVNS